MKWCTTTTAHAKPRTPSRWAALGRDCDVRDIVFQKPGSEPSTALYDCHVGAASMAVLFRLLLAGALCLVTVTRASRAGGSGGGRRSNSAHPHPHHHRRSNCTVLRSSECEPGPPRICVVGPHKQHYDFFSDAVTNWRHGFAFVRYADGENSLIRGEKIGKDSQAYLVDKFWSDGGVTQIGTDLKESLTGHYGEHYYYGFASAKEDPAGLLFFLQHAEQSCAFISYSNLWINAFYPTTKAMLEAMLFSPSNSTSNRSVVVANHAGIRRLKSQNKADGFLAMELPDYVNSVWGGEVRLELIRNATSLAKSVHRYVFFVSGGPMAKVLISHMWAANKNNIYIDFGSAMDEVLKGTRTRPYMDPKRNLAKQVEPAWYVTPDDRLLSLPGV